MKLLGRLEDSITVHASFAWFVIVLFGILLLAVVAWAFLDGPMHMVLDMSTDMSDSSRADEGVRRVRLIWEYWPLWGGALAALLIAFRRATNETRRRF
jgi:hypothetical protein